MTVNSDAAGAPVQAGSALGPHYKWIALSNTTLGVLMVTINQSIVLIALPDVFHGIGLDPLSPGNTSYLLWMFMGFLVVSAVLVVSFGRLGDMFGRVRMYTLGFAVFSVASIFLTVTWMHGGNGALWLIIWRVVQGIGGAFLFANAAAITTDAFPANQRGRALSVNSIAAIGGSFIGLILGGVLAPVNWHLIFLVSAPIGVFSTVWAYFMLHDIGIRKHAQMDWWGNLLFAAGLVAILVGITYGLLPYGGHPMGWSPAHRMPAVGQQAVGDADQDGDQARGEQQVAPPIHLRVLAYPDVVQHEVRPHGAEHADRRRDQEDQVPVHRGEDAAEDEADERPPDGRDRVHAEGAAALVGRERVGGDGGGVGEQERAADALHDPPDDQPQRAVAAVHPGHGQEDRGHAEDREAQRVHPHPAEHVTKPAERDHQYRRHHQEAHEHPQQVAGVTGAQRVQPDAAEDIRQRDQPDRLLDRHHQHAQRRVRQRDPLVMRSERTACLHWRASRVRINRHELTCSPPQTRVLANPQLTMTDQ